MYGSNQGLGASVPIPLMSAAGAGIQVGKTITSTLASMGASFIATAAGFGSMAGPIGTVVGLIVGAILSIFGFSKKVKDPIFGLGIAVPKSIGVAKLGAVLNILDKPMVLANACWGTTKNDPKCIAQFQSIVGIFNSGEKGAMILSSGGTPDAQKSTFGVEWGKVSVRMREFTNPFVVSLQQVKNPSVKAQLIDYDLGFKASQDYHLVLPGQLHNCTKPPVSLGPWCTNNISNNYVELIISKGMDLNNSLNRGLTGIGDQLNKGFMEIAGWDVIKGVVVNEEKAKNAFTPPSGINAITNLFTEGSYLPWLFVVGGAILLTDRRK